ncbi:hypothetical protein GQ600_6203 [Phytophthora cactorum]|nr:hypothetical protein GQ600_6203 [Phytophthora cactorum]
MAFQARWRELKKLDWDSKQPSGIPLHHTYLKPGKAKKAWRTWTISSGKKLMRYLDRCDIGKQQSVKTGKPTPTRFSRRTRQVRLVLDRTLPRTLVDSVLSWVVAIFTQLRRSGFEWCCGSGNITAVADVHGSSTVADGDGYTGDAEGASNLGVLYTI